MYRGNYLSYAHMVQESPWPLYCSLSALGLTSGGVVYWHYKSSLLLLVSLVSVMFCAYEWWGNVSQENSLGYHNFKVVSGVRLGVILFIVSEVMFFFSFFWAFFANCFNPELEVGFVWPPVWYDFIVVDPFSMPLLNSILLLSSGATVTAAHHYLIGGSLTKASSYLAFTVGLGFMFLGLQGFEYSHSFFNLSSGIYGSSFYMLTGFHGLHVTVGVVFLLVCLMRQSLSKVSDNSHTGFEAASWYWHFVDVVWLFLYFFVYWFGYIC